jgi:hypothetical protein
MKHSSSFRTKEQLSNNLFLKNKKINMLESNILGKSARIDYFEKEIKILTDKINNNNNNLKIVIDEKDAKIYSLTDENFKLLNDNDELKKTIMDINLKYNNVCKINNDFNLIYEKVVKEKYDIELDYSYLYEIFNILVDVINDDINEPLKKRKLNSGEKVII